MLHSQAGGLPSAPLPIPRRPPKDGDEDESSESEDEQPPYQMFQVQGVDNKVHSLFKIDSPFDQHSEKNVVYWDELLTKYDQALYIKDKDGKYVDFVKDKASNELLDPLRVAHTSDTLSLILNLSSADETTKGPRIMPLSKGTRIEPERQPSRAVRLLLQLHDAIRISRGRYKVPPLSSAQPGTTGGHTQFFSGDRSSLGPGPQAKAARGHTPPPPPYSTQGGQGRPQEAARPFPASDGQTEMISDQFCATIPQATPLNSNDRNMMATILTPQINPNILKAFSAGANDYRSNPFPDLKGDMIRSEPAIPVVLTASTQQYMPAPMYQNSDLGNPTPNQRGPQLHQSFETQPPTVHTIKSYEQLANRANDSSLLRDMLGSFGDQSIYPLPGSPSPPASPDSPPSYAGILQSMWIPYDYIIVPSLMPTYAGQSPVKIVALCQAEFRPMKGLVSSHVPASTAYVIDDPATFFSKYQSLLIEAGPVLHQVIVTAIHYSRSSDKGIAYWNSLWRAKGEDKRDFHLMTEERPFISICLNKPSEIKGMRDVLKYAQGPPDDNSLTSGLKVVDNKSREIIWRCDACSRLAWMNQDLADGHQVTLDDYGQLCQRKEDLSVLVVNEDAVKHLMETLEENHSTSKIHLEIETRFFNSDVMGDPIQIQKTTEMFGRLARAMTSQKPLLDLKIAARSPPRYANTFQLMNNVFACSSLRELTLVNMILMLEQTNLRLDCPNLRRLCLDNVHVENELAAQNFVNLIFSVNGLEVLHMNRMHFTRSAFSVVMKDTHANALSKRFRNLKELSLVSNGYLSCDQLLDIVALALALSVHDRRPSGSMTPNETCKLKKLDLGHNQGMVGGGWDSFFKRFESRRNTLVQIGCADSGADEKIHEKIADFILVE